MGFHDCLDLLVGTCIIASILAKHNSQPTTLCICWGIHQYYDDTHTYTHTPPHLTQHANERDAGMHCQEPMPAELLTVLPPRATGHVQREGGAAHCQELCRQALGAQQAYRLSGGKGSSCLDDGRGTLRVH